jgi:tetratricopeptide (TPR) repeat protein
LGILALVGAWQGYQYFNTAPQRAEAKVQAGILNLAPGKYDQAIPFFDEALAIDPNSWNAYLYRGIANQNLGKLDDALGDFQVAAQLKPDLLAAVTARAGIYVDKGDHKRAVEELSKVIQLKPSVDAHYRRGTAYALLGEQQKAIEDFTWVIDEVRDAPYVYFARAKAKRALGDMEGAAIDEQTASTFDRSRAE